MHGHLYIRLTAADNYLVRSNSTTFRTFSPYMASQANLKIDLDTLVVQVEGQGDQIDSGSYGIVFEVTI